MSKRLKFTPCVFLPYRLRDQAPVGAVVYDVSSYADHPLCTLSPFWPHGGIPVPGMPGTTSDCVEGIWQGLKLINGKIAPRYFSGQGHKRGGKPRGHQYGNKLLKIVEAREKIYRVSYEWMLSHRADAELIRGFIDRALAGVPQYFHDVSNNGSISDADEGWAHAAVLVQYLNRRVTTATHRGIAMQFHVGNTEAIIGAIADIEYDRLDEGDLVYASADISLRLTPPDLDLLSECIGQLSSQDPQTLSASLEPVVREVDRGALLVAPGWVRYVAALRNENILPVTELWASAMRAKHGDAEIAPTDLMRYAIGELAELCRLAAETRGQVVHVWYR